MAQQLAPGLTILSGGQAPMVGFSQSLTVTVKLQEAWLPLASNTEQLTGVVPTSNVLPEAGVQLTVPTPGQLSVAVTVKVTAAEHLPASLHTVWGPGQVIVGASQSLTVTWKSQLIGKPVESVPVQCTGVIPTENDVSDAGVHVSVLPLHGRGCKYSTTLAHVPGVLHPPSTSVHAGWHSSLQVPVTVTTKEQRSLAAPSVTAQVTVVAPIENSVPEAGSHTTTSFPDPPVTIGAG